MKITSVLSLAVALCIVSTQAAPSDPCSTLAAEGQNEDSILKYKTVRDCYRAQKFNKDIAEKTLKSVESAIGNFYAFVDSAKGSYKAPFKTPKVDLLKGLKKIRETKWKNDYDFQMAITYLAYQVNDGHLSYRNDCYDVASFAQPITLYAPVVNGKQDVRVYYADENNKNVPKNIVDCVVTAIDGEPALQAIQKFTDRTSGVSKDPGVRLNDAFASTVWNEEWAITPGGFARRWEVPEKDSVEYTLKCGSKTSKVKLPWIVRPNGRFEHGAFHDTASYWETQCLPKAPEPVVQKQKKSKKNEAPATTTFKERGTIPLTGAGKNSRVSAAALQPITKATEVFVSKTTAFYRLKNSKVCVAVHATEDVEHFTDNPVDYLNFIEGLKKLRDGGCKKLILDMTNNGGGSVDFAYFINRLFFPKAKPYFVQDLRSNSYVQGASKHADTQDDTSSNFDGRGYVSMTTDKLYKDADTMFTKGFKYTRGDHTDTYSQRSYFEHGWPFLPLAKKDQLPWGADDIAIITNGWCGSACTMIASRFNIVHGVKTYATGGIRKTPLSYFAFPGGFVKSNADIVEDIENLGYNGKNGPTALPTRSNLQVAVGEIYASEGRTGTTPLEYDYKQFAADVQLDQDPVSARHPDNFWVKVAKDF
ncbi:hypothetical protein BGX34_011987 [Mortierella sp. NVP85]|nr:hypothetical protein BGX34_011987 [Mortierella sp. NVP85]